MPKRKRRSGRVTAKQKSARRKNIAVARKSRRKGSKQLSMADALAKKPELYKVVGQMKKMKVSDRTITKALNAMI